MVRVVPWAVEGKKGVLKHCLVGSLKPLFVRIRGVESWLERVWGKITISIKMMD